MADMEEPPASDDEVVQNFLDTNWRESARAGREGLAGVRRIHPELSQHLPETASRHLGNAARDFESALHNLHLAGRHVLGSDAYDQYTEAQTRRQIID